MIQLMLLIIFVYYFRYIKMVSFDLFRTKSHPSSAAYQAQHRSK